MTQGKIFTPIPHTGRESDASALARHRRCVARLLGPRWTAEGMDGGMPPDSGRPDAQARGSLGADILAELHRRLEAERARRGHWTFCAHRLAALSQAVATEQRLAAGPAALPVDRPTPGP